MNKSVDIIVGATSFVGIALIKKLLQENHTVIYIIRKNSSRGSLLRKLFPNVTVIECNIENIVEIEAVISSTDIQFDNSNFYYIAWNSDFENSRYNIDGQIKNVEYLLRCVEVASKVKCKKFLAVGSQAECGLVNEPICSRTKDNPMNAYAIAKCEAFKKASMVCDNLGVDLYWPRLLSAYGPYDRPHTLVMSCIKACVDRKPINMTKAEQVWDFIYIDDVACALYNILEFGEPLKKYSIASGEGRLLCEYIRDISEVFEYPDLLDGIGKRNYSPNEVMYLVGDISEICKDTGFVLNSSFKDNIHIMKSLIDSKGIIL